MKEPVEVRSPQLTILSSSQVRDSGEACLPASLADNMALLHISLRSASEPIPLLVCYILYCSFAGITLYSPASSFYRRLQVSWKALVSCRCFPVFNLSQPCAFTSLMSCIRSLSQWSTYCHSIGKHGAASADGMLHRVTPFFFTAMEPRQPKDVVLEEKVHA